MKNSSIFKTLAIVLSIGLLTFSCTKNDEPTTNISDEEVVEILTSALGTNNSVSLIYEAQEIALLANQYTIKSTENDFCDTPQDSSWMFGYAGANISADYAVNWGWTVNCNGFIPISVAVNTNSAGSFNTQRLASSSESQGSWYIDNLVGGSNFVLAGTYEWDGSSAFEGRNQDRSFDSKINFEASDFELSKQELTLQSGTMTFAMMGTITDGSTYSVVGSVEFVGNDKIIITINDKIYEVDLG
ncbi:MAG: hypothetical protein AAFO07_03780 [Bacteroidota bacterium]